MKKTLLEKTLALIESTSVPVTQICRDAQVSRRWFYRLKNGDFSDPGINKIQAIHDVLSKSRRKAA